MASVHVRHGSEGSWHDPYSWTEIEFTKTDGTEIMLRYGGLGYDRLFVNGEQVLETFDDGKMAGAKFEELTGMTPWVVKRIPDVIEQRRYRRLEHSSRVSSSTCLRIHQTHRVAATHQ